VVAVVAYMALKLVAVLAVLVAVVKAVMEAYLELQVLLTEVVVAVELVLVEQAGLAVRV
jgi:hypothetical protein